METADQVLVGNAGQIIYVSVEGRGNFQNSQPLKDYALSMMEKGHHDFIVNLQKCAGMDSTFMGVLAGLAIKLKKNHQKPLKVVNVSPHNRELLETLGLMSLLQVVEPSAEPAASDPLKKKPADKAGMAKHMLEAHETLAQLSDMNKVKFKNVIQVLQDDLNRKP